VADVNSLSAVFYQLSELQHFTDIAGTLQRALNSWQLLVSAIRSMLPGSASDVAVEWALPWVLFLLPLPFLVYLLFQHRAKSGAALRLPAGIELATGTQSGQGGNVKRWWLSAFVIWMLLLVASARPTWVGPPIDMPLSGRDLLLAIDISGSMRETDLYQGSRAYTRISVVREVAADFVEKRAGDRVGLIMFGSNAYVQTPLTTDHETVAHFIREAEVGLAGRSTAIGDAIGLGVKRLRERPVESRVLLLLTDGANSAGVVDPVEAAGIAAQSEIRIHTIGVGAEARQTAFGFPSIGRASELDEETLVKIAELTGGEYFRARNVSELQRIYGLIDELEPAESDEDTYRVRHELLIWPLAIALLFSLLLTALGTRRYVREL